MNKLSKQQYEHLEEVIQHDRDTTYLYVKAITCTEFRVVTCSLLDACICWNRLEKINSFLGPMPWSHLTIEDLNLWLPELSFNFDPNNLPQNGIELYKMIVYNIPINLLPTDEDYISYINMYGLIDASRHHINLILYRYLCEYNRQTSKNVDTTNDVVDMVVDTKNSSKSRLRSSVSTDVKYVIGLPHSPIGIIDLIFFLLLLLLLFVLL